MNSRTQRLEERFKLIHQTLLEMHGEDEAFAAASAAWLQAIQYACVQALARVRRDPEYSLETAQEEIKALLQSFHKEMCDHLGVDPGLGIDRAKAFRELLNDIYHQGG